jgi:hypothetical protein
MIVRSCKQLRVRAGRAGRAGSCATSRYGRGKILHLAPGPSQDDVGQVVQRAGKRILRCPQQRG